MLERNIKLIRALAIGVLMTSAAATQAASYFKWEMVELSVSTGASCGNGTPYRFFVNRTPFTSKTVVAFEGGGACWSQNACLGKAGVLGATNPNGIPANYTVDLMTAVAMPLSARLSPLQRVQTQGWNLVYLPYCTGDVHTGNALNVYTDGDPDKPLVYSHKGSINAEAVAAWLKANMGRPDKLLVAGFSAGGVGSTANYERIRNALNPKKSGLVADGGPLFPAPRDGDPALYPSILLQNKIREVWGLDGPNGLVTKMTTAYPQAANAQDLGSITQGIAKMFPQDRIGYTTTQRDGVFSSFSYVPFYPEIGSATGATQKELKLAKWKIDVGNWVSAMKPVSNIGYYVPYARDLANAHCTTVVTFNGTAIKEAGIGNVGAFIDNIIDGTGTPMRAFETKPIEQQAFGIFSPIIMAVVGLFGF